MGLEQLRHQMRSRVIVEIRREIGEPDPVMAVTRASLQHRALSRRLVGGIDLGTAALVAWRIADGEAAERVDCPAAGVDRGLEAGNSRVLAIPIAKRPAGGQQIAGSIGKIGRDLLQAPIVFRGGLVPRQAAQCARPIVQCLRVIRPEPERLAIARNGRLGAAGIEQRGAPIVQDLGLTRLERQGPVIVRDRLGRAPEIEQD